MVPFLIHFYQSNDLSIFFNSIFYSSHNNNNNNDDDGLSMLVFPFYILSFSYNLVCLCNNGRVTLVEMIAF